MDPIRTFIRRPIFTSMLVLSLVVFGLYAYPRMGVDQFPDIEFPFVTVTTVLPGADPQTIEKNVTEHLEEALNTLSGLDTMRSVSVESISQVVLRFDLEKDADIAAQEVRDQVQSVLMKLPPEIKIPVVAKYDVGAMPIMTLALMGPLPVQELTKLADDTVKPRLQRLGGVGSVEIVGGRQREISVILDPARLRSYQLAATDVVSTLKAQNVDIPGGRTVEGTRERVVTLASEVRQSAELGQLIIASPMGAPVRVRDVAEIVDGPAEARSSALFNGELALGLIVRKQSGANTVAVAESIKQDLANINATLPAGCHVALVYDGARFIRASIAGVQEDLLIGAVLAVLIVLIFLRHLRSTFVTALALPTSIVGTFAIMLALDFTFNVITMLALTLSIGLLVDDAIVVIENIVRHLEEGLSPRRAALLGTKEIAVAVLAVTLAVVGVFLPVAFMQGLIGRFFYQFGITVVVAVVISYIVSMTLTPTLSARLLKEHQPSWRVALAIERALEAVEAAYRRLLQAVLEWPKVTVLVAGGVLVLTVALAGLLKFTFLPQQDMSTIKVAVELPVGSTLAETEAQLRQLSGQIGQMPGVVDVFSTAGGGAQEEVHKGELVVGLVPIQQRRFSQAEFKQHLRLALVRRTDAKLSVLDYAAMGGGGARPQQVQFNIRGDDWQEVLAAAEKTMAAMQSNPGLVDVDSTYRGGKPQTSVTPERERAASLQVPAALIGSTLRAFLGRDKVAEFRDGNDTYEIKVRLPERVLSDPAALGALTVRSLSGQLVELRNVAQLEPTEGPSQLEHQGQKRQITLLADLKDYSLGEALGFLQGFAARELPKSVITDFEGMGRELGTAGAAFLTALLLGLVLLYMILAAQFESLIDPFTIMLALPLAVIGALAGLLISGLYFSIFAMIGMIMLMGLVAKNGILLVDFTNQIRATGKGTREALLHAAPLRLRPILMTTVAMIAGMIPVAAARGDGAETRVPMAIAIIGGLTTSTFLTLGVVPAVYLLLEKWRRHHGAEEDG